MEVPGRTITHGDPDHTTSILQNRRLYPKAARRNVLLASSNITDHSIFSNGLYQNVYFIYQMLEIMGYNAYLFVNDKGDPDKCPDFMRGIRTIKMDDIAAAPMPILAYIEIGMSIDPSLRKLLKQLGARIIKLYLGNILNIDIETPIFYQQLNFAHHVVGESDEIWVSPHYEMHREYAAALNKVPLTPATSKIAAYVWEPSFLTNFGQRIVRWQPPKPDQEHIFLIMEPNISFQKNFIIPLMIIEAYVRIKPNLKYKVVIVNGAKYSASPYTQDCLFANLDCYRSGNVELIDRIDMRTAMERYPSAIALCHHYNNEYNYMLFEYFYAGYPVIHNAESWSSAGYYYDTENIVKGVEGLDFAVRYHQETMDTYISQGRSIIWRHSIHNPANQEAWYALLGGKEKAVHAA